MIKNASDEIIPELNVIQCFDARGIFFRMTTLENNLLDPRPSQEQGIGTNGPKRIKKEWVGITVLG